MLQPPWLAEAWTELGQREIGGSGANARIRAMFRDAGHPAITSDETAWCAAFVGACLARSGLEPTRSLLARSYLGWGLATDEPEFGAIVVLSRTSDPSLGHVGFLIGATPSAVILLGGNQADSVSVEAFPRERVLSFRRPPEAELSQTPATESAFSIALAHVLEREGGWSDDPYDPGGPTNQGITLATYARFVGREVTAESLAALKAQLRAIPRSVVETIYRRNYWLPARAADLPPGLQLMHFDAAVNHGVGGAARFLQECLAVTIDGEIGPETLSAAAIAPLDEALARYADIRRRRYRALPHFWRFGRGWLARVDATLAAAHAAAVIPLPSQQKDVPTLNTPNTPRPASTASPQTEPKWWGHSLTLWGAAITTLSTVLPVIGPFLGLDITAELVRQIGAEIVTAAQAIGGLAGTFMTVFGRIRATAPLARKPVALKL